MTTDSIGISVDVEVKDALNRLKQVDKGVGGLADTTEKSTGSMTSSISSLLMPLAGLAASFVTVSSVIDFGAATMELNLLAETLGMTVTRVSQLGKAAESIGATEASIKDALSALQLLNAEAKFGEGALVEINSKYKVNISATDNPEDQLKSVANAIMSLKSPAQQVDLANSLGIDPMLIPLLRQGGDALSTMADSQVKGITSERDVKNAKQLHNALNTLKSLLLDISSILITVLGPAFSMMANIASSTFDFLKENLYLVYIGMGLLLPVITALGVAYAITGAKAVASFVAATASMIALKIATIALTIKTAILGVVSFLALLPINVIILGVIAVVALLAAAFYYVWKKVQEGSTIFGALKDLMMEAFKVLMIPIKLILAYFEFWWKVILKIKDAIMWLFSGKVASIFFKMIGIGGDKGGDELEGSKTKKLNIEPIKEEKLSAVGLTSKNQIHSYGTNATSNNVNTSNSNNTSSVTNNVTVSSVAEANQYVNKNIAVDNQRGRM